MKVVVVVKVCRIFLQILKILEIPMILIFECFVMIQKTLKMIVEMIVKDFLVI